VAGAEDTPACREHDPSNIAVTDAAEGSRQLLHHASAKDVALLRPIQPDGGGVAITLYLDEEKLAHLRSLLATILRPSRPPVFEGGTAIRLVLIGNYGYSAD